MPDNYDLGSQQGTELGSGDATDKTDVNGELRLESGANKQTGTATLAAGTIVVANTLAATASKVFLSRKTQGAAPGHLSYTVSNGVSFTITSSSGTDTGQVDWMIVNATDADTNIAS